jgi:hypothetical protein
MWEIEYTDQFEVWWDSLTEDEQERVAEGVTALEMAGPSLGRPWVDTVKGSQHQKMKELRPRSGNLRILFAFDRRRTGILLIGGDKANDWSGWYERMIPVADDLYDEHVREIAKDVK